MPDVLRPPLEHARAKARSKGADLLVLNDVSTGVFGAADNAVRILDATGEIVAEAAGDKTVVSHTVLDEVVRFRRPFLTDGSWAAPHGVTGVFGRSTLAAMLSEALCSRAKRVSETRGTRRHQAAAAEKKGAAGAQAEVDVPFARRAREQGKLFEGGKPDGACCCL